MSHNQNLASRHSIIAAIVRRRRGNAGRRGPRRTLRRLTLADWRLLAAVALAQVVAAAAVRALPLPAVRGGAQRVRRAARFAANASDERTLWAIAATGRRLGGLSSCLVRALVAEMLIDSSRDSTYLTIGVRRAAGTIQAHAWLTRADRTLIGATADEYVPLVRWRNPSNRDQGEE